MNTIHAYDDREQIKYPFLIDQFPAMTVKHLPAGDYITASIGFLTEPYQAQYRVLPKLSPEPTQWATLVGHAVENKRKDFDIQSTAALNQFHKELYNMAVFRKTNPYVQQHAAWYKPGIWAHPFKVKQDGTVINEIRAFMSMCQDYHVRGHIFDDEKELQAFFTALEQPKAYAEFEPFLIRHNDEPSLMAKIWRQFERISPTNATELAKIPALSSLGRVFESPISFEAECELDAFFGDITDNEPTKLFFDVKKQLEEGYDDNE